MTPPDGNVDVEALFIKLRRQIEYQIGRIVRCPETAADLASEMYLKLRRVDPCCHSEREAATYLYVMARTAAIDHIRTSVRRRALLSEAPDFFDPEPEPCPEDVMVVRSDIGIVESALSELPGKAREMLYLSRVAGLTHGEIAERLDVSKSLIEKYIARALTHCRLRMTEAARLESARETLLDGEATAALPARSSRLQ